MIIARSMGRLGNQIFQVAASASHLRGRELFLGLGFEEFLNVFAPLPVARLRFISRLGRQATKRIFRVLELCAWMRLVGQLSYSGSGKNREIVRIAGMFPIYVLVASYPNDERYFDPSMVETHLFGKNLSHLRAPSPLIAPSNLPRCFVHIRRGDFLHWPSKENPAAVPESWFIQEMLKMQQRLGECEFVVISDASENMAEISGFPGTVVNFSGSYPEAFREMLSCDAGILSPSSFSWWAAWHLSREGVRSLVAPLYWNNWMEGRWKEGISESSFLLYTVVEKNI